MVAGTRYLLLGAALLTVSLQAEVRQSSFKKSEIVRNVLLHSEFNSGSFASLVCGEITGTDAEPIRNSGSANPTAPSVVQNTGKNVSQPTFTVKVAPTAFAVKCEAVQRFNLIENPDNHRFPIPRAFQIVDAQSLQTLSAFAAVYGWKFEYKFELVEGDFVPPQFKLVMILNGKSSKPDLLSKNLEVLREHFKSRFQSGKFILEILLMFDAEDRLVPMPDLNR